MTLQSIVLVIGNVVTTCRIDRRLRRGQSTLEYLILFAVVAAVTLIGLTTFDESIKKALQGFFNAAANKITK